MEPSSTLCSRDSREESDASSPSAVSGRPGRPDVERSLYCSSTPRPLPRPSPWDSWEEVSLRSSPPNAESGPSPTESLFSSSGDRPLLVATRNIEAEPPVLEVEPECGAWRTRVQQRRARGDVDFLQKLQCFGVKETNGGTLRERHPHAAAGARHVRDADHRVRVDFKRL
ncbi:hypothetical protein EYF80_030231 [Liparis tanakae]|uniref:Uncharacterized protein n=1 Tax=Liparis tanakae TaxID=230148 RepID=A0A4Z2H1X6_9TELE|nr:hypothetical protein EYF80_030231 [Liparis tanakae]